MSGEVLSKNYHKTVQRLFNRLNLKSDSNTQGTEYPMRDNIKARRKAIKNHIELLKRRYPEHIRREAVEALQSRLETIEGRKWTTNF